MKIQDKTLKEFTPIEITITIESKEELIDLWHRTNIAVRKINDYKPNSFAEIKSNRGNEILWKTLDDHAKNLPEYNH